MPYDGMMEAYATLGRAQSESSVATAVTEKMRRHTGGRPSQAEARRRDERLVEIAAAMFLERGFDATTIDAVAEAASIGKATLYARYKDKSELFAAVLKQQVDRWMILNLPALPRPCEPAGEVLLAMARRMVASSLSPESIAIKRIMIAQATRFPALAQLVHREGWQRTNAAVAAMLRSFAEEGQIDIDDPELAADLFLSLVLGRNIQIATLGIMTDAEQIDRRLRAAVALFMKAVAR